MIWFKWKSFYFLFLKFTYYSPDQAIWNGCSRWSTAILTAISSFMWGNDLLAKMWNIENVWFLERIDHARWLFLFNLACWCDMHYRWGCVCVHGINCAHPTPSLVQHQAKARTEPGGVWRVLSLSHAWVFSSTSGNHLWIFSEHIRDVLVYFGHGHVNTGKNKHGYNNYNIIETIKNMMEFVFFPIFYCPILASLVQL